LVITGYGTNCERETAYAARIAGADAVTVAHFADLMQESLHIKDFNFLIFPGGFLDGDHLGGAQAAASRYTYLPTRNGQLLIDELRALIDRGGLILGICNGFQLLVKLGLLPAWPSGSTQRQVSLSFNDSARFEDRWVNLVCNPKCGSIFLDELDRLYLPVRHGEGKLIARDDAVLDAIKGNNLIALQYADASWSPTQSYPENPNGSPMAIAGLCDPSGRILGLMPHPEAYNHPTNHPGWTRGDTGLPGTRLLENGVRYLQQGKSCA
jgi:phosphoribosylformylglycinamidine synthase